MASLNFVIIKIKDEAESDASKMRKEENSMNTGLS